MSFNAYRHHDRQPERPAR